uniref:Uncharacterized protein n=1 Tax=Plectus sambesii TaxID=2011161 RepID=A0A914WQE0_9BILA
MSHEHSSVIIPNDCHDLESTRRVLASFIHKHDHDPLEQPELWHIWGIGLLMITITAFAASIGILFVPKIHRGIAKQLMTMMGGFGAGALTGATMFVMFPEAFHITKLGSTDYPLKAWLVLIGIYMLFIIDKFFKFFIEFRNKVDEPTTSFGKIAEQLAGGHRAAQARKKATTTVQTARNYAMQKIAPTSELPEINIIDKIGEDVDGSTHMVLFGNLIINLVDGLAIGVAFRQSLIRGLMIGIAVAVQQFPQELTDLAILIELGIGIKKTLLLNLIPAALSYLGFVIGVVLDNISERYGDSIFALAAGMYLYICLSSLIPEMSEKVLEELQHSRIGGMLTALFQIVFLTLGMLFIFGMAVLSGDIIL